MEKVYAVYESELLELIHDSMKLAALEGGGVEHWDWYNGAIEEYEENNGELYELAKKELSNYPEIK